MQLAPPSINSQAPGLQAFASLGQGDVNALTRQEMADAMTSSAKAAGSRTPPPPPPGPTGAGQFSAGTLGALLSAQEASASGPPTSATPPSTTKVHHHHGHHRQPATGEDATSALLAEVGGDSDGASGPDGRLTAAPPPSAA